MIQSRARWREEWMGQPWPAYVTTAFLPASKVDADALLDNVLTI